TQQTAGLASGVPSLTGPGLQSSLPAAGLNTFQAGQFSFVLFNASLSRILSLEISALEADGKGKIISSPRVLMANQVEALIARGTVVIGGIYEQTDRTDITRIPFFGELPFLGFLFRNNTSLTNKTELLVFITPRIVNERLTIR